MLLISIASLCYCVIIVTINAIPIDNGVNDQPNIECGSTTITVTFNTRNTFEGHVYAKGSYDNQDCRSDEGGGQTASLSLKFDTCNVARTRSLSPRGIVVTAVVVITFHPQFITKVDRIYRLQCFYMEAEKNVSTGIEVSEMTTAFATLEIPMPVCRYEILDTSPPHEPVRYADIGKSVYHRWTCDTKTVDTFCALIHSCYVDDGNGDSVNLINEEGCALDKYLLNNLEYPTDLMAGQEAHVYKYADRSQLFYQCEITITVKEPNSECIRPQCPEPPGFDAIERGNVQQPTRRRKRDTGPWSNPRNTLDVRTEISTLDIMEEKDIERIETQEQNYRDLINFSPIHKIYSPVGLCFSTGALIVIIAMFGTFLCAIFIITIFFFRPKQSKLS